MTKSLNGIDGGIEQRPHSCPQRSIGRLNAAALCRLQDGRDFLVRIGMDFQELGDDRVGIEADGVRVGSQVRAAENPAWPLRDVVSLQRLEQRQFDLGLFRDRAERDPFLLAHGPKASTET